MSTVQHDALTDRELEVLELIAAGLSNKAIATELFLSPNTIAWYVRQIFDKLYVRRRTEAVAVARKLGLLQSEPLMAETPKQFTPLPRQTTSFMGRDKEIQELSELLTAPDCRMVTLLGQGGIGKTRLAIAVAEHLGQARDRPVVFVALQPLTSTEQIIPAIARTLGLNLQSNGRSPFTQVVEHIGDQPVLLVVDNFEHLLEGYDIVQNMLRATSRLRLLVTSREALNVQEEYLYPLDGLTYPLDCKASSGEEFSAVALFNQRAAHVCSGFSPDEHLGAIIDICRLVDGIPLAIELAASWLKTHAPHEIANEIRAGLNILVSASKSIPERHRSMLAVIDASWKRLTEAEQRTFQRLSVFRGGFSKDAARIVADADNAVLRALIDKSLVRYDIKAQRFDIHELARQVAANHLHTDKQETYETRSIHSRYFADLLARYEPDTYNENQYRVMVLLDADIDNIREGWNRALEQGDIKQIQKQAQTLWAYYVFRSQFLEGSEVFKYAIERIVALSVGESSEEVIAELQNLLGMFYIRLSRVLEARSMFLASQYYYDKTHAMFPCGWSTNPQVGLGMVALIQGYYREAEYYGKAAVDSADRQLHGMNIVLAHYVATGAMFHQGRYHEALHHALTAYQETLIRGETWVRAEILLDLGRIARELGEYDTARQHFKAALKIREGFGDTQGVGAALIHLGKIDLLNGDIDGAEAAFSRGRELYRQNGDRGGMGLVLCGLGKAAFYSGSTQQAKLYFGEAIHIARLTAYAPLLFNALLGLCEVLVASRYCDEAGIILRFILHHERCNHETKDQARQLANTALPENADMIKAVGESELDFMLFELGLLSTTIPA